MCESLDRPLVAILGKAIDVQEFNINSALFHYLLGYEFPETILVVQETPVVIVSPRKALILQQIEGLRVVIKNKDDTNLDSILSHLNLEYGVVDRENIKGDFCEAVLSKISYKDVTKEVVRVMSTKEPSEIDLINRSGVVSNYLLQKGIDLIRDINFTKENLENHMNDLIRGVDNTLIEYSFDPEDTANRLRLGIRYRGYCTEIARPFLTDLTEEYDIQKYMLSIIRPGLGSGAVLAQVRDYCAERSPDASVKMYTVGLMARERVFEDDFELQKNMVFCLNISDEFCNTFVLDSLPIFVTRKDTKEDYSEYKMRFRNKGNDMALISKIKEHQKELLDKLIEEQVEFYHKNPDSRVDEKKDVKNVIRYEKDSDVPRSDAVFIDWEHMYVLLPVLSYSIPFHISAIKNGSVTSDGTKLRINFKESKEIQDEYAASPKDENKTNSVEETENAHYAASEYDTTIKSISVRAYNCEELLSQINEMKKEFNKPKLHIKEQGMLKEKYKKYALTELYMKTDNKSNSKKILGSLELHENGFKYNDTVVLFSSIKNVFYEAGDFENKAILHFNLKQPVAVSGKATYNLQFFRKFGFTYHDTNKREDEHIDLIQQQEEEIEINRINSEFSFFIDRVEQETRLKIQLPEKGFLGVHSKEAVHVSVTSECLVSIVEQPFFVLNFDEIEIVNFERVTFVTKTFDCVFIFKNKRLPVVAINSIETTRLGFLKELLDSHNIIFMETKVNINWPNLMTTIMRDPLGFYESGGWAELLREDEEEDSDGTNSDISNETDASTVGTTTSSEELSESYDESDQKDDDSFVGSDDESSSEDNRKKRRR